MERRTADVELLPELYKKLECAVEDGPWIFIASLVLKGFVHYIGLYDIFCNQTLKAVSPTSRLVELWDPTYRKWLPFCFHWRVKCLVKVTWGQKEVLLLCQATFYPPTIRVLFRYYESEEAKNWSVRWGVIVRSMIWYRFECTCSIVYWCQLSCRQRFPEISS